MNRIWSLLLLLPLATAPLPAIASSTETAYKAAQKQAAAQYASDKKLCADESTSSARMQCLRDAKAEYTKALSAAKEAKRGATSCADCGRVIEVVTGTKKGEGGPLGMIGGGIAGALLGHQVGAGTGKDVATIAGAAGGAYAGSKVEEKLRSTKFWSVKVRLDSGEERTFEFDHDPGFASGDLVKVSGDSVSRR
ncbi:MAG TPA: glycine zipper 2TM domain-containing protein [Rhodocyclaceae bacterium]|nr:glycine zipper 2TM domain-containing protein [Rhodocyclaceae bacterium]